MASDILSQLQAKSRDAYYSLMATESDLRSYTHQQVVQVRGWDISLSSTLLACISKTSERGSLLLAQLAQRERRARGTVIGSGRAIWDAINATMRPQYGGRLGISRARAEEAVLLQQDVAYVGAQSVTSPSNSLGAATNIGARWRARNAARTYRKVPARTS